MKKRITKFLRAEALLISVIIFIFAGKYMMTLNQNAFEEKATIKTASISNDMVVTEQFVKEIDTSDNPIDRFVPDGRDLDAYTAGRYSIWKGYAQFLNMTGNDFSKADWKALTGNKVKHAHNNFLEIAYRCGIPVACLHLLLELIAGIICIIYLFSKRFRDPAYLFSIVFMITYAIQSMFDIATIPFERPAPFYFYMAMIPIFMFKRKKINEDEETRNKNCITEAVE